MDAPHKKAPHQPHQQKIHHSTRINNRNRTRRPMTVQAMQLRRLRRTNIINPTLAHRNLHSRQQSPKIASGRHINIPPHRHQRTHSHPQTGTQGHNGNPTHLNPQRVSRARGSINSKHKYLRNTDTVSIRSRPTRLVQQRYHRNFKN